MQGPPPPSSSRITSQGADLYSTADPGSSLDFGRRSSFSLSPLNAERPEGRKRKPFPAAAGIVSFQQQQSLSLSGDEFMFYTHLREGEAIQVGLLLLSLIQCMIHQSVARVCGERSMPCANNGFHPPTFSSSSPRTARELPPPRS